MNKSNRVEEILAELDDKFTLKTSSGDLRKLPAHAFVLDEIRKALTTLEAEAEKRGEDRMKRAQKETDEYYKLREEKVREDERERIKAEIEHGIQQFKDGFAHNPQDCPYCTPNKTNKQTEV